MPRDWQTYNMLRASLIFAVLLILTACQSQPESIQLHGATMGTTWSVNLHSLPDSVDADLLEQQLQERLDQVNRLMSTYDPESEISRFNRFASTEWFSVSTETATVIGLSQQISELTGGAFDITVGPLVELWGFGARERGEQLPSQAQVAGVLGTIGYRKLQLRADPPAIKKAHPLLQVDLSAVAKGYAVDDLTELLHSQQVDHFLVEVGGELRVSGLRTDSTPWRIAIEKPAEGIREVEQIFALTDIGLATSGNYRNFYIEDGQRYVHTIDPVSGYPISHQLASATVLAKDCATADALATALMVLGEERGRQLVEENRLAAYFLIHQKDAIMEYRSPAFTDFVEMAAP